MRDRLSLLRANLPNARWVAPEDYHLTLRFIGDCDGPTIAQLVDALATIEAEPFIVQPEGLGTFGHDKPRALWVGISENPALLQLKQQVDGIVRQVGLPLDGRKYTPHITLARMSHTRSSAVARALDGLGTPLITAFTVDAFALYSSGRSRGGGPYAVEETFPLAASEEEVKPQ